MVKHLTKVVSAYLYVRFVMEFRKICVLGLGYTGLPTAATFAAIGLEVIGVDIKREIIDTLNRGGIHIQEPGLHEMTQKALSSGSLRVQMVPEEADAFIIEVPTPFYEDKRADLRAVCSATKAIVPFLRRGNLVVLESTSPPQTTEEVVVPILEESGLIAGDDFLVCYSPERVLPGRILKELKENARVIGGITPDSAQAGAALYRMFVTGEIIETTATTAEMVKLMENTYRDVNIAIANEFSRLAERFGVSIWEAVEIANLHPRVEILRPGIGVGGHCISVDPWFFVEKAPDLTNLIRTAREVNDGQPHFVVDLVKKAVGGNLHGKKIAALGLSYKANVDDVRESPAVEIVRLLEAEGAIVKPYEPYKPDVVVNGVASVSTLENALVDVDLVLFQVAHDQFKNLTPETFAALTKSQLIVDAVRVTATEVWRNSGYKIFDLGVG
jgi:UDP-N-acetyl-D-mannosaminuronic acid dehydrogenase